MKLLREKILAALYLQITSNFWFAVLILLAYIEWTQQIMEVLSLKSLAIYGHRSIRLDIKYFI